MFENIEGFLKILKSKGSRLDLDINQLLATLYKAKNQAKMFLILFWSLKRSYLSFKYIELKITFTYNRKRFNMFNVPKNCESKTYLSY